MTLEVQTEVAPFTWQPLATRPHGRKRLAGEPIGWAIHTQDALALDDIGVGDSGGLVLQLPLVVNNAYRLIQGVVSIRDTDGNASLWRRPCLRMYWHPKPDVNPGVTTQIIYPMSQSYVFTAEGAFETFCAIGGGSSGNTESNILTAPSTNNRSPGDMPILYGYTAGGGIAPEFMISNTSQSQTNYTISYQFRWLVFSIEDSLTTSIFNPVATIPV